MSEVDHDIFSTSDIILSSGRCCTSSHLMIVKVKSEHDLEEDLGMFEG